MDDKTKAKITLVNKPRTEVQRFYGSQEAEGDSVETVVMQGVTHGFIIRDLEEDVTVVSHKGGGSVRINGCSIVIEGGEVWDILLSNGCLYSCQEPVGSIRYDSSGQSMHGN